MQHFLATKSKIFLQLQHFLANATFSCQCNIFLQMQHFLVTKCKGAMIQSFIRLFFTIFTNKKNIVEEILKNLQLFSTYLLTHFLSHRHGGSTGLSFLLGQGWPNFLPRGPHDVRWTSAGAKYPKKNVPTLHEHIHHSFAATASNQLVSHIVYSPIKFYTFYCSIELFGILLL